MTATDELRRLLDERGVEWSSPSGLNSSFADSITFIGDVAVVSEIDGSDLLRINFDGTPEQAIDATLGRGTCQVKGSIIDTYEYNRWEYELSCGHTIIWEDSEPPNYCPNCGAKVVDPTTNDVDAEVTDG